MIKDIEFRHLRDDFQDQLQQDIKKSNNSTKAFIPANKTPNYYQIDKATHNKLLADNITMSKKADDNTIVNINNEAKTIAANLNIDDRTECVAEQQAFITLKDHKDNFQNNKLLTDSIIFAKQYIDIIIHSRKLLLFDSSSASIKCANWLASSFLTDCPTNTGKKVSDFTGTTGSQFLGTSQDHKQYYTLQEPRT